MDELKISQRISDDSYKAIFDFYNFSDISIKKKIELIEALREGNTKQFQTIAGDLKKEAELHGLLKIFSDPFISLKRNEDSLSSNSYFAINAINRLHTTLKLMLDNLTISRLSEDQCADASNMDTRLFAQIQNDNRLLGNNLQGASLFSTTNYLEKFLKKFYENKLKMEEGLKKREEPDILEMLHKKFEALMSSAKAIERAREVGIKMTEPRRENLLRDVAKSIVDKILKSTVPDSIITTGGWIQENGGGHAMIYEFRRETNGKIIFLIYNTGDGLNYHLKEPTQLRDAYSPIFAYEIPSPIDEDQLTQFMKQLLEPLIKPVWIAPNASMVDRNRDTYNADRLYKQVFAKVSYLSGVAIDPSPFVHNQTIQGQISGTCAMRVLMPLLRNELSLLHPKTAKEEYQEMLYELKKQSIIDYFNHLKRDKKLGDVRERQQLIPALEKFSNHILLRLQDKKGGFKLTKDRAEADLKLIETIRSESDKFYFDWNTGLKNLAIEATVPPVKEDQSNKKSTSYLTVTPTAEFVALNFQADKKELEEKNKKDKTEVLPVPRPAWKVDKDFVIDAYLKSLKAQCDQNLSRNLSKNIIEDIEQSLLKIPLYGKEAIDCWRSLTYEQAKENLKTIRYLILLYSEQCEKGLNIPFAQKIITIYTGMVIASQIVNAFFQQDPAFKNMKNLLGRHLREWEALQKNAYFVSYNNDFDKRVKDISNFFLETTQEGLKFGSESNYDQEILVKHPDAQIALDPSGDRSNLTTARCALYALYNSKNKKETEPSQKVKTEVNPSVQKALKDFDICVRFEDFAMDCILVANPNPERSSSPGKSNDELNFMPQVYSGERRGYFGRTFEFIRIGKMKVGDLQDLEATQKKIEDITFSGFLNPHNRGINWDSNHIQTKLKEKIEKENKKLKSATEKSLLLRAAHTRAERDCQVLSTLEFFNRHIYLLEQIDYQTYFELQMFSPNLLMEQLKVSPQFSNQLVYFIQRGLNAYFDPLKMNSAGLFFLRMSFYLQRTLEKNQSILNNKVIDENIRTLATLDNYIFSYINQNEKIRNNPEKTIEEKIIAQKRQRELYDLYVLRLGLKLEREALNSEDIINLMTGHFFKNTVPHLRSGTEFSRVDPNMIREMEQVFTRAEVPVFNYISGLSTKERNSLFTNILDRLGSSELLKTLQPLESLIWEGTYPKFTITNRNAEGALSLNLREGTLTGPNYTYMPLPDNFYFDENYLSFFGGKERIVKCYLDANSDPWYQFTGEDNLEYRIYLKTTKDIHERAQKKLIIQRKMPPGFAGQANGEWYQFQNRSAPLLGLPLTLQEHNIQLWNLVNLSPMKDNINKSVLCDKNGRLIAALDINQAGVPTDIFKANESNQVTSCKLILKEQRNAFEKYFCEIVSRFENDRFLEVWRNPNWESSKEESPLRIRLPRYGLEFVAKIINNEWRMMLSGNSDFYLAMNKNYEGYLFDNVLHLEKKVYLDKEKTKFKLERQALLPRQQVYTTGEEYGAYHKLVLDTNNTVPTNILETKMRSHNSVACKKNLLENNQFVNELDFNYKNQEKYFLVNISSSGEFKPKTTEEFLYIAYLYLSNHNPGRAYYLLCQCKKDPGFTGSQTEIEWLRRIMEDIPVRMGVNKDENEEEATVLDPEVLAVKAEAAFLVAQFKYRKKMLTESVKTKNNVNEVIKAIEDAKTIKFYNDQFSETTLKIFKQYDRLVGNIPEGMRLSSTQELALLRQTFFNRKNLTKGSIGHHWKILETLQLKKEQLKLEVLEKTEKLSKTQLARLEKLRKLVIRSQKREHVYQKGELEKKELEIIPKKVELDLNATNAIWHSRNRNSYYYHSGQHDVYMDMNMEEEYFLKNFYSLCDNARFGSAEVKEKLHKFLSATITVDVSQERDSKMGLLSRLLMYVIKYPEPETDWSILDVEKLSDRHENFANELVHKLHQKSMELYHGSVDRKSKNPLILLTGIKYTDQKIKTPEKTILEMQAREALTFEGPDLQPKDFLEKFSIEHKLARESEKNKKEQDNMVEEKTALLSVTKEMDPFIRAQIEAFNKDYHAGAQLNRQAEQERIRYVKVLGDNRIRDKLQLDLKKELENFKGESIDEKINWQMKNLERDLVEFANQKFDYDKLDLKSKLEIQGKQRRDYILLGDLLGLYLQGDRTAFKRKTFLNDKEVEELYNKIHHFLLKITETQHWKRINDLLKALKVEETEGRSFGAEFNELLSKLGSECISRRHFVPSLHPEFLLFEYYENTFLREEQVLLLEDLLRKSPGGQGYTNQIVQLIMGGGKSKVISPLLSLKRADGTNLVVLQVPNALFETTSVDLSRTIRKLFGLSSYVFEFGRDHPVDSSTLKAIYKHMISMMVEKGVMITTPESVKALELKYIELLMTPPSTDTLKPEWKKQIRYLEAILKNVLKDRSDVLIDEVDITQHVRKSELNFTMGASKRLPEWRIKTMVELYRFFDCVMVKIPRDNEEKEREVALTDIMSGREEVSLSTAWDTILETLANRLVWDDRSPIADIMKTINESDKALLEDYLCGHDYVLKGKEAPEIPPSIVKLLSSHRQVIDLLRGEITQLLPSTLKRKFNEQFGFSHKPGQDRIAIPYQGNRVPAEGSQFGSADETANLTIQAYRSFDPIQKKILELPEAIIEEFILEYKTKAEKESTDPKRKEIILPENTKAAKQFFELTGMRVTELDIEHPNVLKSLQKTLSNNTQVIDYCLINYILNHVEYHPHILRSNGQNHLDQSRSVAGCTGTPWNRGIFSRGELPFNERGSLGTDGRTINHMIRKNTPVYVSSERAPSKLLSSIFKQHESQGSVAPLKLHAIIDVGAFFRGIDNEKVAREIARYLTRQKNSLIRFVLFFDNNQLCALPVNPENADPIPLRTTDLQAINKLLDCGPENRFTYYDQVHTTGTDITQPDQSTAALTVALDTMVRDVVQGGMRMRKFAQNQSLISIISPEVAETRGTNPWRIEDVIQLTSHNQIARLGGDHLLAAIQRMDNIIRRDVLKWVYSISDIDEKQALLEAVKEVFLMETPMDVTVLYARLERERNTNDILTELAVDKLNVWRRLRAHFLSPKLENEETTINEQLQMVVRESIPLCFRRTLQIVKEGLETQTQKEKESEKEKELEQQKEQEIELKKSHGQITPYQRTHFSWLRNCADLSKALDSVLKETRESLTGGDVTQAQTEWYLSEMQKSIKAGQKKTFEDFLTEKAIQKPLEVSALNEMVFQNESKITFRFSEDIYASHYYKKTYQEQQDYTDEYEKPVNFFLLVEDPLTKSLKAVLITPEEAADAKKIMEDENNRSLFGGPIKERRRFSILTPQGSLFYGDEPNILNPQYQAIREQIAYFNGDLDVLSDFSPNFVWLNHNTSEKVSFLEQSIMPHHLENRRFLGVLKERLKDNNLLVQDKDEHTKMYDKRLFSTMENMSKSKKTGKNNKEEGPSSQPTPT